MKPKEKAKALFEEFLKYTKPYQDISARQAAIVCTQLVVDEIIDALSEYDNRNNTYELQNMDRDFNYWNEVRQEIDMF